MNGLERKIKKKREKKTFNLLNRLWFKHHTITYVTKATSDSVVVYVEQWTHSDAHNHTYTQTHTWHIMDVCLLVIGEYIHRSFLCLVPRLLFIRFDYTCICGIVLLCIFYHAVIAIIIWFFISLVIVVCTNTHSVLFCLSSPFWCPSYLLTSSLLLFFSFFKTERKNRNCLLHSAHCQTRRMNTPPHSVHTKDTNTKSHFVHQYVNERNTNSRL